LKLPSSKFITFEQRLDECSWSKVIFPRFLKHLGDEKLVAKAARATKGVLNESCAKTVREPL
jgi:hypothetical protein